MRKILPLFMAAASMKARLVKRWSLPGAMRDAENVMVARDCMLAAATGASVSIQHISSKEAVAMVRFAKQLNPKIVAEGDTASFHIK